MLRAFIMRKCVFAFLYFVDFHVLHLLLQIFIVR